MNRPWPMTFSAGVFLALFAPGIASLAAEEPPESDNYSAWKYQESRKRYWCAYHYRNGAGQQTYQYVFYYPDARRSGVYYFQTRAGRIWACCVRPGGAEFSADTMKWYRQSEGRWIRRADDDCPRPPDGGERIGEKGGRTLPVIPPPKEFEDLSPDQRKLAEAFHKRLAEVTIEDGEIVAIDFGGTGRLDELTLIDLGGVTSLRRLYLDSTKVGDKSLAQLKALKKLEHLDLSQTFIGSRGLKHLAGLKSLRTLILRGCQGIQPADTRALKKANGRLLITGP